LNTERYLRENAPDVWRALTAADRDILYALGVHVDWQTGKGAYPGLDTLAAECGHDRKTVQRRLPFLERAGLIARQPRSHQAASGQRVDVFDVICPPTAEPSETGQVAPPLGVKTGQLVPKDRATRPERPGMSSRLEHGSGTGARNRGLYSLREDQEAGPGNLPGLAAVRFADLPPELAADGATALYVGKGRKDEGRFWRDGEGHVRFGNNGHGFKVKPSDLFIPSEEAPDGQSQAAS
jgi:hypothetical protein